MGAFIGPLFGVLIADFYLVRKQHIVVDDLFTLAENANYWYRKGYNPAAVAATLAGAALAVIPVLLGGSVAGMASAAQYSWFIGCGVGFGASPHPRHARAVEVERAAGAARGRRHLTALGRILRPPIVQ